MRMLNLLKFNNRLKKSQVLLFGSLFIFLGVVFLSWDYLARIKNEIYSDMNIAMMNDQVPSEIIEETVEENSDVQNVVVEESKKEVYVVDYSKYLGVLEIPKIRLKRGFYNVGNRYNDIRYNVTVVDGSTMPDVVNGNLILMAHSGTAYISYFANLWKLEVGDTCFVTYAGQKYSYQIVDIYEVEKNGIVRIKRNSERTTLTMITCTKDNDYSQTVYIAELVG